MRWFARDRPGEIWDEAVRWPIGDIEAAGRVREICLSAAPSAEYIGGFATRADNREKRAQKRKGRERERYERAARAAMEIALKMSDDLMRDDAVRRIVGLCMKADDVETAQALCRAVGAAWIREAMLRDHPGLG